MDFSSINEKYDSVNCVLIEWLRFCRQFSTAVIATITLCGLEWIQSCIDKGHVLLRKISYNTSIFGKGRSVLQQSETSCRVSALGGYHMSHRSKIQVG